MQCVCVLISYILTYHWKHSCPSDFIQHLICPAVITDWTTQDWDHSTTLLTGGLALNLL